MKSSREGRERFVFVLGESELELVPKEILTHSSVLACARERRKRPSNLLLDASYHHSAMRALEDGERRGRPDIVHFFLMLCLDSRLNRAGALKTIVHTRNDERIIVSPETRLPPSYHRFVGLMESLFQNRVVPSKEEPLLTIESGWRLRDVICAERCDRVIVLDSEGVQAEPKQFLCSKASERTAIVIGGFPSGQFRSDLSGLEAEKLSFGKEMLRVWTVTSEMLVAAYESITAP
jgi:rRNA small subunit pseudouridine methyltransferase Nep1